MFGISPYVQTAPQGVAKPKAPCTFTYADSTGLHHGGFPS